jgi:hypothetical protein
MLDELLKRSECRMACRRLSISEARREGPHLLLISAAIDNVKWASLDRSVPEVRMYLVVYMRDLITCIPLTFLWLYCLVLTIQCYFVAIVP